LPQGNGLGYHGLAVGFLADVTLDKRAANFAGNRFAFFDLHVGDHDRAAQRCQHPGCALAKPRGAACDDENLACDVHKVSFLR
jgi:nitrite reductase/ring-hydroxylating ferredoxin subunit